MILTTEIQPNAQGKFECPECKGTPNPRLFDDRGHLGIHRRTHGIRGTTYNSTRAKLHSPGPGRAALSPVQIARMQALHKQGVKASKIAAQLGISVMSVYKYTRKAKEQLRKPAYRLSQPIVERAPVSERSESLISRLQSLEEKILAIEKAIGI